MTFSRKQLELLLDLSKAASGLLDSSTDVQPEPSVCVRGFGLRAVARWTSAGEVCVEVEDEQPCP